MATPNPSFQGVSEERGSVRKRVYRRRSWPSRPCDRHVQAQGGGQLRVRPRPPVLPRAAKPSRRLALRDERRIAAGGMLQEAQRRPAVSRRVGQATCSTSIPRKATIGRVLAGLLSVVPERQSVYTRLPLDYAPTLRPPVRERLCYPNREGRNMPRWMIVPLLCLCLLQAQEPAPPPATVFSVGTTLVQIDSVVTDSKGQQVAVLKPGDFQVLVDGKPQPITNFSYVHLDSPDVNRPGLSPQALRKPLPSANPADVLKPEDVRRSMVLVVDDLSLSFESMHSVRQTLRKFIDEQMQPGDLVALWETGRGNSVFQQFTSDKRVLQAAVENLRWNPRGLGVGNPFEPEIPRLTQMMNMVMYGTTAAPNGPPGVAQAQRTDEANETAYTRMNATDRKS